MGNTQQQGWQSSLLCGEGAVPHFSPLHSEMGARSHLHLPEIREFILFLCLAAEFRVVMNEARVPLFIVGFSVNGTALNYLMRLNLLMSVVIRAM